MLSGTGDSRFNDGACDPTGRFLVGSMALDDREGAERLYRLDGFGDVEVVDDGLTLSNGLGWSPDGQMLYHVDTDGNLWVAVGGAGQVRCFSAAGEHVATVEVAAPHTSSAAFVGAARDRLLITTGREDLTEAQLDSSPLSGRLFLADVGRRGVPTVAWSGRCAHITQKERET